MARVNVIGAGAWGTALGVAAHHAGNEVALWSIDEPSVAAINNNNENPFLPNIALPKDISATTDLGEAIDADALLMVIPAQVFRSVCESIKPRNLAPNTPLIICSKGIEQNSLALMSEIVTEHLPNNPIAVLSGPNFADEVAKGEPAATTLACADKTLGMKLLDTIGSKTFRTYYSDDIIGAQLGGAVKNVLAIACGVSAGLGYGENTKVAIVTRGITELARLCQAKGGNKQTLLGLCGMGDMMLTCGTTKSRNMSFGHQLGQGKSVKDILAQGKTVEGVPSSQSVADLAAKLNVDMPICNAVYQVIHQGITIEQAIKELLSRPLTEELF